MVERNAMKRINIVKQKDKTGHFICDPVTRRDFLKNGSAGLLSIVAVGGVSHIFTFADGTKIALAKGVILADKSLCSGCRICERNDSAVPYELGAAQGLPAGRSFLGLLPQAGA